MNPDATLRELKELALRAQKGVQVDSERLAELVLDLDDWICAGGPLPSAWDEASER